MKSAWVISMLFHAAAAAGIAVGAGTMAGRPYEEPVVLTSTIACQAPEFPQNRVQFSELKFSDPGQELPRIKCEPAPNPPELGELNDPFSAQSQADSPSRVEIGSILPGEAPAERPVRKARCKVDRQDACPSEPVVASSQPGSQLPEPAAGNPPPRYPLGARRAGAEGLVKVALLVSESGEVRSVRVAESSGSQELDEAALAALRRWRFAPAMQDGHPVAWQVIVPVRFSLQAQS